MTNQHKINKQLARELDTFLLLERKELFERKHPTRMQAFFQKLPRLLVSELLALLKLEHALEDATKAAEAADVFADPALTAKIEKFKETPNVISDLLKTLTESERAKFDLSRKYKHAAEAAENKLAAAKTNVSYARARRNESILALSRLSDGTLVQQSLSFYAAKLPAGWIPEGYALDFVDASQTEFRLVKV